MNTQRRRKPGRSLAVLAGVALAGGLGAAASAPAHAGVEPDPTTINLRPLVAGARIAEAGQQASLIASVYNQGPADATNWVMTTTLPEVLAPEPVIDATDIEGTCAVSGRTVTCSGAILGAGESFSIRLIVTAAAPGTESALNTAVADQEDYDPSDNTDDGVITVGDTAALGGDWGTTDGNLMAPGTSQNYSIAFTCLSADGCAYAPGMTITDTATNGGTFSPGTNNIFINDLSGIGTCEVTATEVSCEVTASGSVSQGDVISARTITYIVPADAPADTQIFAQRLTLPSGWVGNDTSNDVYPISTPPEVGAPIVSWQGAAAAAGIVLFGAGGVMLRRRQLEGLQNAA